jgi:uncharacterized membrane protein YebE (DUF533 family)
MPPIRKTGVLSWLGNTVRGLIDKAAEESLEPTVLRIEAEINRLRKEFNFANVADALHVDTSDRALVARLLYRRYLKRCWRDSQLTATESELLSWLASNLGLADRTVAEENQNAALDVFGATLAKGFADGQIDDAERKHLENVASAAGRSVTSLMAEFFECEGEQFVRSVFTDIASNGQLTRHVWNRFSGDAEWLGIPQDRMLEVIRQPAQRLVEHALADARSDGEITEREELLVESLLNTVIDDDAFQAYIRGEIAEAKEEQNLARGLLPSATAPPGIALRAGEIVHWAGPVSFSRARETANGVRVDTADGTLVITDARAILDSPDRSADVNHRRVLAHIPFGHSIEIRCSGKGAGRYEFSSGPRPVAIWQVAIGRANQTIVASDDREARRRIPRDVRQRVWQKYGGRCAECKADTYLEFDHIIPVAKGGGNSDTNVQLLCRKCNLTKSDSI